MKRTLLVALVIVLMAPALASAATPLPVGSADGVKVARPHGSIHVTFGKRLHRRLAGKVVGVYCTELPDPKDLGFVEVASGGSRYRVPKRRRTINTGDGTRGIDYCEVWRPKTRRTGKRLIAAVPLTQRGA